MRVALVDVDGHNFPNLALAKLARWHRDNGDSVEWYDPKAKTPPYDRIYASKVFTFSKDFTEYKENAPEPVRGGTGYRDYETVLPAYVESVQPDLSLYPKYNFAYGFLSRGCVRSCSFCVVPQKEGYIRQVDTIDRVSQERSIVKLMDNNFLANDRDFVKDQLGYAASHRIALDFNQGLDCRLMDEEMAGWLSRCNWRPAIRFACDHQAVLSYLRFAVYALRLFGYKGDIYCYVLAKEVDETLDRIAQILTIDKRIFPFVQPWRDLEGDGEIADPRLRKLARWCNRVAIRKTCSFQEYQRKSQGYNEKDTGG